MRLKFVVLFLFLLAIKSMAAEGYKGSAEAGVTILSGNTESESYNLKSENKYTADDNILAIKGNYVRTKLGSSDAIKWDASVRYERVLAEYLNAFIQQKAEGNQEAGFTQKNHTDLGLKYFFIKEESKNLFSELGYRSTLVREDLQSSTSNYARLYVEWNQAFEKQWSYKLWAEYVPNVDNGKSDFYSTTYEGSISVTLSDMFSLKSALIEKRQNKVTAPIKNEDRTFTTSLVANF
jgi:putative salt-induced outer membrane protein